MPRASRRRRPSPLTGAYAPAEWRAHASLDGRPIDLARAFSWRPVRDLVRIAVATADGSRVFPYREIDDFAAMPFQACGPGTMTRRELRERGMTDAKLERAIAHHFGVRLHLAGGRDTPRKRCLRFEAHALVIDALTSADEAPTQKKKLPPQRANVRGRDRRLKGNRR